MDEITKIIIKKLPKFIHQTKVGKMKWVMVADKTFETKFHSKNVIESMRIGNGPTLNYYAISLLFSDSKHDIILKYDEHKVDQLYDIITKKVKPLSYFLNLL